MSKPRITIKPGDRVPFFRHTWTVEGNVPGQPHKWILSRRVFGRPKGSDIYRIEKTTEEIEESIADVACSQAECRVRRSPLGGGLKLGEVYHNKV